MSKATQRLSAALAAVVTLPLIAATGSQDATTDPEPDDSSFIYRDLADDAPAPTEYLPETTASALTTSSELQPAPASGDDSGIYTPEMDTADELLAEAVGTYLDLVDNLAAGGASHLVVFHDAEYSLAELEAGASSDQERIGLSVLAG